MNFVLRYPAVIALAAILGGCATETAKAPPSQSSQPEGLQPKTQPAPQASTTASKQQLRLKAIPLERSVFYDLDKYDLRPDARALIEANARYLRDHPGLKVRVEGNADERGSAEYNLALGQRRAQSVAKSLELLGVADDRIEAVSFGEEKPKKTGHDEASWAENRRSDIVY